MHGRGQHFLPPEAHGAAKAGVFAGRTSYAACTRGLGKADCGKRAARGKKTLALRALHGLLGGSPGHSHCPVIGYVSTRALGFQAIPVIRLPWVSVFHAHVHASCRCRSPPLRSSEILHRCVA